MKYIFLGLFFSIHFTYSAEAVVTVPQTAFYLKESETAEISEYRLQGNIIFIHGFHNTLKNFHQENDDFVNDDFEQTKFYKSLDRIGRQVYVKASDVFIYYGDQRELTELE